MFDNPILLQKFMKERVKDTLREAEKTRLVKLAQNTEGTRPFLLSAMQFISDWQGGGNSRHQPTIDNMKQRKRQHKLAG